MRHARASLALLAALAWAADTLAQAPRIVNGRGPAIPIPIPGPRVPRGVVVAGFGPAIYAPFPYGGLGPRISTVTIYSPQPSYSGGTPIVVAPQITVNVNTNTGPAELRDEDFPDKIIIRPGQRVARPAPVGRVAEPMDEPEKPLPGDQAGGFRPVRPEDRDRIRQPMPPERPEGLPPVPPEFRVPQPPPIPQADLPPKIDPAAPENERLVILGRRAFADREYGRAERRFALAVQAAPRDAVAHFCLAQAQFALGKYREAVASIHAGLRLRPDWPSSRFQAREMYGPNIDDFVEHLQQMQLTLARHKDDPALLFLYAYELWFDGRQDDAKPYFQRALPRVMEPRFVLFFLQAQQAGVVAMK